MSSAADYNSKDLPRMSQTGNNLALIRRTDNEEVLIEVNHTGIVSPTHYKKENGLMERGFRYTDDISSGTFNEIYIDGAHIFFNDLSSTKTRIVDGTVTSPVMQMYFLLEGENSVSAWNSKPLAAISRNQHNLFFRSSFKGKYHLHGEKFKNFGIQLSEKFFSRLIDINSKPLDNIFEGIHSKKMYAALSNQNLQITPSMRSVIYDIMNNKRTGHMKRLFMESKIIELFMLQVEQAENEFNGKNEKYRKEEIDKLYAAKSFIEENILEEFTLLEVSREVGLNDFKLKKGFKDFFGTTVFGYLNDLKMNYAKRLLIEEKKHVYETAMILGYSEPHHFSAAFKRKFGYSPKELK